MVIGTIGEVVVLPSDAMLWRAFLPKNDRALKLGLTRAFLGYLGVPQVLA
jgi:hypothetical protein